MKQRIICPACGGKRLAKMYLEFHGFEILDPYYNKEHKVLEYKYGPDVDHIEDANVAPMFVCLDCDTRYDSESILLIMNNIKHD